MYRSRICRIQRVILSITVFMPICVTARVIAINTATPVYVTLAHALVYEMQRV